MKLRTIALFICTIFIAGCSFSEGKTLPDNAPLGYILPAEDNAAELRDVPNNGYIPLNYSSPRMLWLPYMDFADYMYGKSEEEFRDAAADMLNNAMNEGINTVFFHVHPNGDAYYSSDIFPRGTYYDGDYDPLAIMVELSHERGISVHGWLNPLRLQTISQMDDMPDGYAVKEWVNSGSPMVKRVGERWYLDPSYDEVRSLVCKCAAEILERYEVDGIHIDDYFYPTADPDFDSDEFAESGAPDLSEWRRDNISRMVSTLYDTVKSHDRRLKFSVSPQGNIDRDYDSQYADVELWGSTAGYADQLIPQIYYGFRNETCPFEPTLRRWENLVTCPDVELVVGLAAYKVGEFDKWAGAAGENEWVEDEGVIERQIELVENSSAVGYALYK